MMQSSHWGLCCNREQAVHWMILLHHVCTDYHLIDVTKGLIIIPFAVLQSTDLLRSCGLIYHSELHILICLSCKAAYLPTHIQAHQKDQHQVWINNEDLNKILRDYDVHSVYDDVPTPPPLQAPIEGIKIEKGLHCILCPYVGISSNTMRTHWSKEHSASQSTPIEGR
jgi:hypothetical protein